MKLADPNQLYWLFGLVGLLLFFVVAQRRRNKAIGRIVSGDMQREMLDGYDPSLNWVRYLLIINVFTLAIVALARPQLGFEWREVKRQGTDMLIILDTSKSMLTQDIKPNRLERTKLALRDLVKHVNGDRIGLMAFAGDAFLVCPLTVDYNGFLLSLDDLSVDTIPRGGTNIAVAIEKALEAYKDVAGDFKAVVVITDGDNLQGDPQEAADLARDNGLKVYTVGVGTREGELIQLVNRDGSREFLKDSSGNFVKSRLNESLLQDIALKTGGAYVKAGAANFGLELLYKQYISKLEKKEFESSQEKQYYERFQFPLALALILLVVESCFSVRKKSF